MEMQRRKRRKRKEKIQKKYFSRRKQNTRERERPVVSFAFFNTVFINSYGVAERNKRAQEQMRRRKKRGWEGRKAHKKKFTKEEKSWGKKQQAKSNREREREQEVKKRERIRSVSAKRIQSHHQKVGGYGERSKAEQCGPLVDLFHTHSLTHSDNAGICSHHYEQKTNKQITNTEKEWITTSQNLAPI